tara:strand:+ start:2731 stop:4245 length:1515 start_codon:yes stop_codon:yes gene_type:complete
MSAIITEKFRMSNATIFKDDFANTAASYYMFLGKSHPWSSLDATAASDSAPPTAIDDVTSEFYYYDDMLAAKKLGSSDVSFVIPRRNWTNGATFDMYEHDISTSNTTTSGATNIYNSTFYFTTSQFRVYKVLDNAQGAAMTSGNEPSSETNVPFEHQGYILQYMYTISASDADKFLTNDFMPVATNTNVAGAATDGAIVSLRVTNTGTGLTNGSNYYVPVRGDGSGAVVRITVAGGVIQHFGLTAGTDTTVSAKGSGYTYGTISLAHIYNSEANALTDNKSTGVVSMGTIGSAAIEAIYQPKGGHGSNAPNELGGHYVMINTTFSNSDAGDVTEANDFRRVGLLKNPYAFGTTSGTTYFTGATARQTKVIKFQSGSLNESWQADEQMTQQTTGAIGRVVEYDASNDVLYYLQERFTNHGTNNDGKYIAFSTTALIEGGTTAGQGIADASADSPVTINGQSISFTNGYANPELQPDSGDVIYIENRKPITRVNDQTEDIKIIVEF